MFKVGDKVFSCQFGWGIIDEIDTELEYPISVDFIERGSQVFTKCGRYFDADLQPTLSFTEYYIVNGGFSQEHPRDTITEEHIGKLVKILNEGVWEGFIGVLDRVTPLGYFEVNGIEFENVELYGEN